MLRDDGLTVQVYHVAESPSKGMRVYKNQSSALEPENGDLAMTRCGKEDYVGKSKNQPNRPILNGRY
jgi:hypothetical protein